MARHRAARRSGPGTVAVAVAAMLAGLLLGGTPGTFAFWTDTDEVVAGSFTTGVLDLTVDGQQGTPTAYVESELTLDRMVPGESVAATLTLHNAGDADFTWSPSVTSAGFLSQYLSVTMVHGVTAEPVDTAYPRTQGCAGGGTQLASGAVAPALPVGASTTICVRVALPNGAGNEAQGRPDSDFTLVVRLDATQVTS